eukprot:171402-Chlamydomonas_euryale.AAC.1
MHDALRIQVSNQLRIAILFAVVGPQSEHSLASEHLQILDDVAHQSSNFTLPLQRANVDISSCRVTNGAKVALAIEAAGQRSTQVAVQQLQRFRWSEL